MPANEETKNDIKKDMKKNTVQRKVSILFNASEVSKSIRKENINGREFIVSPCKLMPVACVMNECFYPDYASFDSLNQWNGKPVTLRHPIKDAGNNSTSANNPAVFQTQVIGHVFNAMIKDSFVHAELYIDVEKTKTLENGEEFLEKLNDGVNFDVSTGMSVNAYSENGSFNGQEYNEYITSFAPDHLAVLLNERGACSWNDGAGTPRTNSDNKQKTERVDMTDKTTPKENTAADTSDNEAVELAKLQKENAELKAFYETNKAKVEEMEAKENKKIEVSITSILENCEDEAIKTRFNSELKGLSSELLGFLSENKTVVVRENVTAPKVVVEEKTPSTVKDVENVASSGVELELDI